jgi:hypothetical protein
MKNLYNIDDWTDVSCRRLGEILLEAGKINLFHLSMVLDVQKFKKGKNGSAYYWNWDEHLLKMNDALGDSPTFNDDGTETWSLHINKNIRVKVGFKMDDGALVVDASTQQYKDPNKPVLNRADVISAINEVVRALSIFEEYGFIVR